MNRTLPVLAACLALAACGTRPAALAPAHAADFASCRSAAVEAPRVDTLRQRITFIDDCMAARGWTPAPACVYTDQQGTAFCEYRR
jgi:hypothetical protein